MPEDSPSPFVYWAQTAQVVTLKVDLKDSKEPKIVICSDNLKFIATGKGATGLHEYKFAVKFHGEINDSESSIKIQDAYVLLTLAKASGGFWPKLTSSPIKPPWLKIDFDRWNSEDATLDDDEHVGDVREDYPDIYNSLQKEEIGYVIEDWRNVYLVIYNLCQFVGYLYIIIVMGIQYSRDGEASIPAVYKNVGNVMKLCQLFQILEIMHPLFGYTKNSVFSPFLQVTGRSIVLFGLIDAEPRLQPKPVVFYLFLVWSLVEIVRYPYYIAQLQKLNIPFLTWLRYTIWIPLYPLGFIFESIIYLRSIPYFEETKKFCVAMPNAWNVTFDTPTAIRIILLLLFIPAMSSLMTHMYRDRVKKLHSTRVGKLKKLT